MELINYHQLIIQGMKHLNAWSHLDCVWFSKDNEKVHAFIANPIPDILDFHHPTAFYDIKQLCTSKKIPMYCVAATASSLEFIFIPLIFSSADQGMVRIGPYLTNPLSTQSFFNHMTELKLPIRDQISIRHYYESQEIISHQMDINLGHIAMNLFGYTLPLTHYCIYTEPIYKHNKELKTVTPVYDVTSIEHRYTMEHKLMHAISFSDRELLDEAIGFFQDSSFMADRHPDNPLRSAKNMSIILNTILRHAAETGGLHPYYLHQLSTKYALLIEQSMTRTQLMQLQYEMYESYFEEVKNYAHKVDSPFIKKVMDYIHLNLEKTMTVNALADKFRIKAPNLANQFKSQTGLTVSEFINKLRIQSACYYLENSELKISDISSMIGYQDMNYFIRVFKKKMGVSPSNYRNK